MRVKLTCYEREGKNTLSLEDYLKAFMETEVKPLWPKGWMQARCVTAANVISVVVIIIAAIFLVCFQSGLKQNGNEEVIP